MIHDTPNTMPAAYLRDLVTLAERWDVEPNALLEDVGLTFEDLASPTARIELRTMETVVERVVVRTGEPGIAFHMGLKMRISSHGFLGFAAMTARNLGEALELAERFAPTRNTAITLRTRVEGDRASILLDLDLPKGALRQHVALMIFVGLGEIALALTGRRLLAEVDFDFPRPEFLERFAHVVPGELRFDRPRNRITIPARDLELPLVSADPVAMQLALEQCERELASLGRGGDAIDRVRNILGDTKNPAFGIEEVARRLGMSSRTLKRRLAEHGKTFSDLVEDYRRERALALLSDARLTIDVIAARLGYSDAANFTRAFKRWTGRTPASMRSRA